MGITYQRELTDTELKVLEHFVPNATEWIDAAVSAKIESCKKQLIRKQIEAALEDNAPIPSTASDVLASVFEQKDYKNRAQRIADENAEPLPVVEPPLEVVEVPEKDDGNA